MGALPRVVATSRGIGQQQIVELAEKIRSVGIHGTVSIGTLRAFDVLARGKTFGTQQYAGEAEKLVQADGLEYTRTYPILQAICDTIVRHSKMAV